MTACDCGSARDAQAACGAPGRAAAADLPRAHAGRGRIARALQPAAAAADMCDPAAAVAPRAPRPAPRANLFLPCATAVVLAALLALCAAAPPLASDAGESNAVILPWAWATSMLPPVHPSTLELSEYPPVGRPAELTFNVTYSGGGAGMPGPAPRTTAGIHTSALT